MMEGILTGKQVILTWLEDIREEFDITEEYFSELIDRKIEEQKNNTENNTENNIEMDFDCVMSMASDAIEIYLKDPTLLNQMYVIIGEVYVILFFVSVVIDKTLRGLDTDDLTEMLEVWRKSNIKKVSDDMEYSIKSVLEFKDEKWIEDKKSGKIAMKTWFKKLQDEFCFTDEYVNKLLDSEIEVVNEKIKVRGKVDKKTVGEYERYLLAGYQHLLEEASKTINAYQQDQTVENETIAIENIIYMIMFFVSTITEKVIMELEATDLIMMLNGWRESNVKRIGDYDMSVLMDMALDNRRRDKDQITHVKIKNYIQRKNEIDNIAGKDKHVDLVSHDDDSSKLIKGVVTCLGKTYVTLEIDNPNNLQIGQQVLLDVNN